MPLSVSLALYADETAIASTWHVPAAHEYEAWSDARAFDGTVTIQQPQVRRLYGGHSAQELLAVLQGNTLPEDYGLLRAFWQKQAQQRGAGDFEHFWHESVRIGVVAEQRSSTGHGSTQAPILAAIADGARREPDCRRLVCCSAPTRWSRTDDTPTIHGCWRCRGRSPG